MSSNNMNFSSPYVMDEYVRNQAEKCGMSVSQFYMVNNLDPTDSYTMYNYFISNQQQEEGAVAAAGDATSMTKFASNNNVPTRRHIRAVSIE